MAYLRKQPRSPYYQATFKNSDGRFVERSTKCETRREAAAVVAEWEKASRKALAGELTRAQSMKILDEMVFDSTGEDTKRESLCEFFARWLAGKETRRQFSTANRYRPILNAYLEFVGDRRANSIVSSATPREIGRFRDNELKLGKAPSTADFALKVLGAVFEAARKEGQALTNPATSVERLNQAPEERLPFTDKQVQKLLKHANDDWRGIILLAYHTGIRLADAANLTRDCIVLEDSMLTFVAAKTAPRQKTRNPETTIFLHDEFIQWLKARPEGIGKAPVFLRLHGQKTGSAGGLSNAFAAIMKAASVIAPLGDEKEGAGRRFRKLSFHSLRHTFISRLANASVDADVRKAMAGHSSDQIHAKYTHLDLSTQQAAVSRLPAVGI